MLKKCFHLKNAAFNQLSLKGANFYGYSLQHVYLATCDPDDVHFKQMSLKGVNISTCTFDQLHIDMESLNGCSVSAEQAIGFAKLIGLTVKK
ncbi:pentapeptide repeat-containing protein [Domibacillus iocasae]|uniref:Pentapeptide repeat-containing protein n=1 Tax=Domibacillus iocasae TaxID=1714016 RepID=A0A1E7DJX5_9BACI|nr:pentapeptide repeat-containing protein [Domibacillus iocasae]OES43390.1 hypothetical protein BA724_13255 [Domibacillus iocasae]